MQQVQQNYKSEPVRVRIENTLGNLAKYLGFAPKFALIYLLVKLKKYIFIL